MLTDFNFALTMGIIVAIIVCTGLAFLFAIRQHEELQTRDRLTLNWVHTGLVEPPMFDETMVQPPPYKDGPPTMCWPMVLELNDDYSEPDLEDLPARLRFQFSTRAETKAWGQRQPREPIALTIGMAGYPDRMVTA